MRNGGGEVPSRRFRARGKHESRRPTAALGRARAVAWLLAAALAAPCAASADDIAYVTRFEGLKDTALGALLKKASELSVRQREKVPSEIALERRAANDVERLREALRSEGYYDALIDYRIDDTRRPIEVTVLVDAGTLYAISEVTLDLEGQDPVALEIDQAVARLRAISGGAARAKNVVDAEATFLNAVIARGYPFATIHERHYLVDHKSRTLAVDLVCRVGPRATFGEVQYEGLEKVEPGFVRNRLPWKEGDRYDPAAVKTGEKQALATGLFADLRISHDEAVAPDGSLPMKVHASEAKFRTVSLGLRYDSTLGFGGGASWEHRNVRGSGERLRLFADVAEAGWSTGLSWQQPDFWRPDYTLTYGTGYEREETTAYTLDRAYAALGLAIPINERWSSGVGVGIEWTPVETEARETVTGDREQDETFLLLGFPFSLSRSTAGSLLEPRSGTRVDLAMTPYVEISGKDLAFLVTRVTPSAYLPVPIPGLPDSVLASRLSFGAIEGAKRDNIPADKRFYAGGGGSIRGYEYQRVGPLDDDDEPLGGRSLFELGTELRLRLTQSFGVVGFFEGGNVYPSLYPDFDDVIRWGTGGGLRYYSPVGPIRVDIGTPVNGRDGIDHAVQFYISLGEAF